MPKVSVIVPVYNVEKYLNRCIGSILNQTFHDFELILVDDGSTDESGAICDKYKQMDERVITIHKSNAGVSAARNTGLDAASGDYIMFVDSDDYIDSEMLQVMLLSNADIIFSGIRYTNKNMDVLAEYTVPAFEGISLKAYLDTYYIDMNRNYIVCGPYNKLFKGDVMRQFGLRFDERFSICEDGLFVVQYLKQCKTVANVNQCFYNYVQYGVNTLMTRYNENAAAACEELYKAKVLLIESAGEKKKLLFDFVNKETLNLFMAFYSQIYIRSSKAYREKYLKAKEILHNKTFQWLIKNNYGTGFRKWIMKVALFTGCVAFPHFIWSMKHIGKKRMQQ